MANGDKILEFLLKFPLDSFHTILFLIVTVTSHGAEAVGGLLATKKKSYTVQNYTPFSRL